MEGGRRKRGGEVIKAVKSDLRLFTTLLYLDFFPFLMEYLDLKNSF